MSGAFLFHSPHGQIKIQYFRMEAAVALLYLSFISWKICMWLGLAMSVEYELSLAIVFLKQMIQLPYISLHD